MGLFRLNLKAVGIVPKAELAKTAPSGVPAALRSHRRVWFAETGGAETPVYWRPDLAAGATFKGPASLNKSIPPPSHSGFTAKIDGWLNIILSSGSPTATKTLTPILPLEVLKNFHNGGGSMAE